MSYDQENEVQQVIKLSFEDRNKRDFYWTCPQCGLKNPSPHDRSITENNQCVTCGTLIELPSQSAVYRAKLLWQTRIVFRPLQKVCGNSSRTTFGRHQIRGCGKLGWLWETGWGKVDYKERDGQKSYYRACLACFQRHRSQYDPSKYPKPSERDIKSLKRDIDVYRKAVPYEARNMPEKIQSTLCRFGPNTPQDILRACRDLRPVEITYRSDRDGDEYVEREKLNPASLKSYAEDLLEHM
jgi:hypothetical protein